MPQSRFEPKVAINEIPNTNTSTLAFPYFQLLGAYSVSKTALLGLVKSLANGLGTDNIRVNGIAPGIIKTNFSTAVSAGSVLEGK